MLSKFEELDMTRWPEDNEDRDLGSMSRLADNPQGHAGRLRVLPLLADFPRNDSLYPTIHDKAAAYCVAVTSYSFCFPEMGETDRALLAIEIAAMLYHLNGYVLSIERLTERVSRVCIRLIFQNKASVEYLSRSLKECVLTPVG
jgi:hypothetical protein